jgi:hypothetical protein
MALISVSDTPRYSSIGIGGPLTEPSGRRPSRMAVMIWESVQAPIPVSLSGVMLGAKAVNGALGPPNWLPPAKALPCIGPPLGVWQLAQVPMVLSM